MSDEAISEELLQKISAFRGLNTAERRQLRDVVRAKSIQPGEKVLVQGKQSQYLWFLIDGQCQVVRDTAHTGPIVLAELEPYSLFGEMSFFSPAPHSADVVAKTAVKLLCISRTDYDDLVRDGVVAAHKLAYNIVESVARKLRRMNERLAELAAGREPSSGDQTQRRPDWHRFRETLLDEWSL